MTCSGDFFSPDGLKNLQIKGASDWLIFNVNILLIKILFLGLKNRTIFVCFGKVS